MLTFLAQTTTFTPRTDAVGGSVVLSALVGILPLLTFFVLLGVFKLKTHWCAVGALGVAVIAAIWGFGMPSDMVGLSALQGFSFGIAPIILIVVAAVWLYNLTVASRRAEDVRTIFSALGRGDIRVQALLIGFSFCGLLEGLAGFGAPVAIVAAMLVTLGLPPLKAAIVTMVGNAINVGFGAMAVPVATVGQISGIPATDIASTASSITPWISTFVPFLLLVILDGMRGIRQLWLVALVQGLVTSAGHFVAAHYISFELTAILASLLGFAAAAWLVSLKSAPIPAEFASSSEVDSTLPSTSRVLLALLPYVLVVIIFSIAKLWRIGVDVPAMLASTRVTFPWPGLDGRLLTAEGTPSSSTIFGLDTLGSPALMIAITALIVAAVYGANTEDGKFDFSFARGIQTLLTTIYTLRWSLLTIGLVMTLAYVMNFSGQTTSIGAALAATGTAFAFLSPILGWIGTAVTGSATSSNTLFGNLQATAAQGANLPPDVLLSANTIGGGIGKIVSPQNLAIAATAISQPGSEPEILRKAAPWSLGLLGWLMVLTFLASQGILPIVH